MFQSGSRATLALLLAGSLYACAPRPQETSSLPSNALLDDRLLTINRDAAYRRSVKLYQAKQFAKAEGAIDLLLVRPNLSQEDRKFLLRQKEICRDPSGRSVAAQLSPASFSSRSPEEADCGARALAIALRKLGVHTDAATLRKDSATTGYGATLMGLRQAARKTGVKAEGVRMDLAALRQLKSPAVAWFNGDHYVAVLQVRGDRAHIEDPNGNGPEWADTEHLIRRSAGILLILTQ